MGQKVNPVGFRTGIMIGWKSRWYASKKEFADLLIEDHKIRKFVKTRQVSSFAGIPKIEIERTRDEVKVILHAARPGVIIGRKGQEVEQLQDELQNLIGRRINIKIEEITRPEIQAQLVAEDIAEQLAKRASFRRTMKRAIEQTMEAGAKGIKIQIGRPVGRCGNGSPRKADCRFDSAVARCGRRSITASPKPRPPKGNIGVQVWINQGMYEDETNGADAQAGQAPKKPKRTYKR